MRPLRFSQALGLGLAAGVVVGYVIGFFAGDDSDQIGSLEDRITRLSQNQGRPSARRPLAFSLAPATNAVEPTPAGEPDSVLARVRQIKDDTRVRFVQQIAADRSDEYSRVFAELGMAPEDIPQAKQQLALIHETSLQAESTIAKLLTVRNNYERLMESRLTEDNFQRYRAYEEAKPAIREYGAIHALFGKDISEDAAVDDTIIRLIGETGAYTMESWDGPFDGPPRPTRGARMVIAKFQREISEIEASAQDLLMRASEARIPKEYIELIASHYQRAIDERLHIIDREQFRLDSAAARMANP